jgi:predicted amidophosphoribosyltransferase
MPLFGNLVDLVLPRRCVGCGGVAGPLCLACRPGGAPIWVETTAGPTGIPTVAAAVYADAMRAAVLAYKERGRRDLAVPLAGLLAGAVACVLGVERGPPGPEGWPPQRIVLVPVPSARAAVAARGGDHVLRLGRRAAVLRGLRVAPGAVSLVRAARDSAGLGIGERAANLDHAMAARQPPPGAVAVLVDDIVTTGATLREAARALGSAGWPIIGAAVVAATPRRFGSAHPPHWQHPGIRTSVRTT